MSVRDILQAAAGLGGAETFSIYSAGQNSDGNLGLNLANNVYRSSPVQIGALDNWVYINNGNNYAFAINSSGDLYGWGINNFVGQGGYIGDLTNINRSSPVQVGTGKTWAKVFPHSTGDRSTYAITESGQLWAWGDNASGAIGQNSTALSSYSSPVQIGSLTNWKQASSSSTLALFVKTDGTLWYLGRGQFGGAGINVGSADQVSSPVQVGALTDWDSISYTGTVLAIKTDGTLWGWGLNSFGTVGDNSTVARSSPVQIGAGTNWAKVSIGQNFEGPCFAIKTDGTLWSWGRNLIGALGLNDGISRSSPVQIGSDSDWVDVSAGNYSGMALKSDGSLYVWGNNQSGQMGRNLITNTSSPVLVGTGYLAVSAGVNANIFGKV